MQWFGKAIGAILGFAAGGPIGSLLGVAFGHRFDERRPLFDRGAVRQISQLFFEVTFEVMGQVAKVDGRVSEDEVRVARAVMQGMQLTPDQVRSAIDRFTTGKGASYPLAERLAALERQIGDRRDLGRAFMQIQLQSALGAGPIGPDKRQLLWRVANALHVSRADLAQLEEQLRAYQQRATRSNGTPNLEDAYRVLGIAANASDADVKKAYRRLMNQHHPDKLVSRGLPESMAEVAEQKTLEVRAAYEAIKDRRGFK